MVVRPNSHLTGNVAMFFCRLCSDVYQVVGQ